VRRGPDRRGRKAWDKEKGVSGKTGRNEEKQVEDVLSDPLCHEEELA